MKTIVIKCAKAGMNFIYFFMKGFKTENKVTFISRQGNSNSLDFKLVQEKLKEVDKDIKIVALNKRFRDIDPLSDKIKYCFHIFVQMYHIATSKVVVLETYAMPISMLNHKKDLKVIQMWHALGSLKKFGYSVIDKSEGSNLHELASMHKNYDYILTSSEVARKNFSEAFNYPESSFKIIPLPRTDFLMDKKKQKDITNNIINTYPGLKKKKTILYAPTFRKNGEDEEKINELIKSIDYEKYNLILKLHPLTKININNSKSIIDEKYSTIEWLNTADYVITDYSAIVYEAALLKKPLFFYTYDFNEYELGRDFYLNYKKDMPGVIKKAAKDIFNAIEKKEFDLNKVESFAHKYVDYHNQDCTLELVNLILSEKDL